MKADSIKKASEQRASRYLEMFIIIEHLYETIEKHLLDKNIHNQVMLTQQSQLEKAFKRALKIL